MPVIIEIQVKRKGPVAYPCIACGSPVGFEQVYCAACLRAAANQQRQNPDAILEREWLCRQIETAA